MVRANYTQPSLVRTTGRPSGKPAGGTMPTPDQFRNQASIFSQAHRATGGRGSDPTKHFGEIIGKRYADGHIGGEHHHGHRGGPRGHHEGNRAGNSVQSFFDRIFGRRPEPKANPFSHQERR